MKPPLPHEEVIAKTRQYVKETLSGDATGHDWWHIERVTNTALALAKDEGADPYLTELAALLHDIADWKFNEGDESVGPDKARIWLEKLGVETQIVDEAEFVVRHISFKGATNKTPMRTLEGQVVQDADRLDALGAIGIARAFAFGGSRNRPMYDPAVGPQKHSDFAAYRATLDNSTTINHFYEKLLLIKDRMNTPSGRKLAEKRHKFIELYLEEFFAEWDGR